VHSINSQSAMVKRNARESRGSPKDRELKSKQKTVGLQRGNNRSSADVRDAERRRTCRLATLATPTTRIHGQEQRGDGDGDGDGDGHVVADAGRSVSRTARAGSAEGNAPANVAAVQ